MAQDVQCVRSAQGGGRQWLCEGAEGQQRLEFTCLFSRDPGQPTATVANLRCCFRPPSTLGSQLHVE